MSNIPIVDVGLIDSRTGDPAPFKLVFYGLPASALTMARCPPVHEAIRRNRLKGYAPSPSLVQERFPTFRSSASRTRRE